MGFLEAIGKADIGGSIQTGLALRGQVDAQRKAAKLEAEENKPVSIESLGLTKEQQFVLREALPNLFKNGMSTAKEVKEGLLEVGQRQEFLDKLSSARIKPLEGRVNAAELVLAEAQAKLTVSPEKIAEMTKAFNALQQELIQVKGSAFTIKTEAEKATLGKLRGLEQEKAGFVEFERNLDVDLGGTEGQGRTPRQVEAASDLSIQIQNDKEFRALRAAEDFKGAQARAKEIGEAGGEAGGLSGDKNISTLDLAFAIEKLEQKRIDGTITPEENKRLKTNLRTQARASTLIPGLKTTARRTAKEEAELDFKIKPDKRGSTLDPKTFSAVPFGTTNRKANEIGAVLATTQQMAKFAEMAKTKGIVDVLGTLALKAITAETAAQALVQGAILKAGAVSRANAVAAAYESEKTAFLGVLSRSIAAERGVLTDKDIARVAKAFPGFRDTKEIAEFKIKTIKFLIENSEFAVKQEIFGLLDDDTYQSRKEQLFSVLEAFRGPEGTSLPGAGGNLADEKQRIKDKYGLE